MLNNHLAPLIHFSGISLGLLLILLLLTSQRGNRIANRWLAGYVACLVLLSLGDLLEDSRWVLELPHLAHVTDWLIFMVGPFLWMYVRRLTMHETPSARRWLWHCLPAVVCLGLLMPFYFMRADEKLDIVARELGQAEATPDIALLLAAAQLLFYWVLSIRTLQRFGYDLHARFSSMERRTFGWLKGILAVNLCMWVFWLVGLWLRTWWATWLDVVAVPFGLYLLAFLGMRQPAVFVGHSVFTPLPIPPSVEPDDEPTARSARYERSGLDRARVPQHLARLEALMQSEKPWLENDLTLTQLADRAGLSAHHLSQLLNEEVGTTFFEFVNGRRVEEVKRCLADPAYDSQSILEIGLAAGFNSKAAFNAAFKQRTGLTPSAFRQQRQPRS